MAYKTPAWTRKEGKDPKGGLNRKGIASYRRENPGSKLSMAVTTSPSKLKPGSKAASIVTGKQIGRASCRERV